MKIATAPVFIYCGNDVAIIEEIESPLDPATATVHTPLLTSSNFRCLTNDGLGSCIGNAISLTN